MKVVNMTSSNGRKIPNQFIIYDENFKCFQSYQSIIAKKEFVAINGEMKTKITLDVNLWDYSATTGKYRNMFLNEGIAETRKKIESGEYILADLNS